VLATIGLYVVLPARLIVGPRWLVPGLELAVLVPLAVTSRFSLGAESLARRLAEALLGMVNIVNALSAALLARRLVLSGANSLTGHELVQAALSIWLTNVLVYGLWFWELDRGGPSRRGTSDEQPPDFLFPQMTAPQFAPEGWAPGFMDYLYVALTNAAAFSPTDTMPLSRWAKLLMAMQSLISLVTVVVVAARAINIL
jgi:uncharacterized membrane protein